MSDDVDSRIEQLQPLPTPTLYILVALRAGARHGYAVMQDVETFSEGTVRIGAGTLYGAIKRLVADGVVSEVARPAGDDERRRYYRLTELGERLCDVEVARLATLVRRAGPRSARLRVREV